MKIKTAFNTENTGKSEGNKVSQVGAEMYTVRAVLSLWPLCLCVLRVEGAFNRGLL